MPHLKAEAWTKGPWRADIAAWPNGEVFGFSVQPASIAPNTRNAHPITSAGVSTESHLRAAHSLDEIVANAHLIVAAPTMAEALQRFVEQGWNNRNDLTLDDFRAAVAALRRAQGEG